jgi:methionyl aminopeptidase
MQKKESVTNLPSNPVINDHNRKNKTKTMNLKNSEQIKRMREAGLLLWETHQVAKSLVGEGVTTKEIDAAVDAFIQGKNAIPLFKGVPAFTAGASPFPAATCISINEQVVHGIPSGRKLIHGDIVSIDIGVKYNGWSADAAVTYPVGAVSEGVKNLLRVTEHCLKMDIELLKTKSKWSKVVKQSSSFVRQEGFSVIEELVGHAIGKEMHESPPVPNHIPDPRDDFKIRTGLVLAIEPMINMGKKGIVLQSDGWTYVSEDNLPSAHFEHTVAITETGPMVLTCGPSGEGWAM